MVLDDALNYKRIWSVLSHDILEDRRIDDNTFHKISLFIIYVDSILPWVCKVMDHSWLKNVVRTSVTLRYLLMCRFFVLTTFDVIYNLLLKRHTATWNLFVHHINSQDLIVDSPLLLLHMSLEISIENFVLDQDNNFEPDEF